MGLLQKLFRVKPESPAEKQALANLDEATREVAWGEEEKEEDHEHEGGAVGPLTFVDRRRPKLETDPDPAGGPSMHDVMHEHDEPV